MIYKVYKHFEGDSSFIIMDKEVQFKIKKGVVDRVYFCKRLSDANYLCKLLNKVKS